MNIFHKITLKNLKANRTRTLVTIVGIILSAAMFSATTISISTLRNALIQSVIYENGSWYGGLFNVPGTDVENLLSDGEISQAVSMEFLGHSLLEDSGNTDKPYLCLYGIQPDFTDMMPIHITEGRMPETTEEILLPEHLASNGGISHELEDTLELNLGTRVDTWGDTLSNHTAYLHSKKQDNSSTSNGEKTSDEKTSDSDSAQEHLVPSESRSYKVVGFYERPSFEPYEAPGYTALTVSDNDSQHLYDLYLRTVSGKNAVPSIERIWEQTDSAVMTMNYDLLRLYGYSGESRYNQVLFGLAAILICIIAFGSISLIYNAFSISVSERTQQFGLLSSIGATRRQLTKSVLFEALFLGCIGIPLGILSGILGIGITFFFVKDMLISVLNIQGASYGYEAARLIHVLGPAKEISLKLHPSFPALMTAVCVSLLTILISAYIPVRRAVKKSAIDAIRQTSDIAIRPGKVKTSKLTKKLFGFEGMIAAKNYKRNRKKYRATVISLFLSIVLFVSTSSWCAYLMRSVNTVISDENYDIFYNKTSEIDYPSDTLRKELAQTKGVTKASYFSDLYLTGSVNTEATSKEYQDYRKTLALDGSHVEQSGRLTSTEFRLIFLEDEFFRSYLKELNLPESAFFNEEKPVAVAVDSIREYDGNSGKYYSYSLLEDYQKADLTAYLIRYLEDYDGGTIESDIETGELYCEFWNYDTEISKNFSLEEGCLAMPISIGASAQKAPAFFSDNSVCIQLFYPYSLIDAVVSAPESDGDSQNIPGSEDISDSQNGSGSGDASDSQDISDSEMLREYQNIPGLPYSEYAREQFVFQCENHAEAASIMRKTLSDKNLPTEPLYDYAASAEGDRALVTVIYVFVSGFIALISLIAAANVFNTISTNINLRRREFAMLKSIGMTPKGFTKMMNFECLLYGFKGLLYGLPVSFVVTWLIYRVIAQGLEGRFFIPWYSIVISVGSVFLVVFSTMLYSMSKIKKENTIDVLKNENI